MATNKDTPKSPEPATTAATTEAARNNVRLGYSATLADRVMYADGVHGIASRCRSMRLMSWPGYWVGSISQSVSSAQAARKAKQT